jgi:16S rRNA G966 N2-methylase RsmD
LIEDIDEMAKRNNMVEIEGTAYNTEQTNRDQMTIVTLFEYLIANTDWSVPSYHNIKLIGPKDDKSVRPYSVAYDFDICGFVDPPYATIDEQLQDQISSVRDRLNRGFPRTMEELKVAVKLYNDKKEKIMGLIKNNEYLNSKEKSKAVSYVEDFYKIINNDRDLQRIFVDGGRKN